MRSSAYEQRGAMTDPMPAFEDDEQEVIGGAPDHSLGYLFTLLDDGIPENKIPDDTMVWGAFVRIAMSAQLRDWSESEFITEVTGQKKLKIKGVSRWRSHRLWTQHCELNRRPQESLNAAWEQAAEHLADRKDMAEQAVMTALLWDDRLLIGVDHLDDVDTRIMDYVVVWIQKRRMCRVTCPVRDVAAHAGIGKTKAHRRLRRLVDRGLLIQWDTGHASKKKFIDGNTQIVGGRAAIYSFSNPLLISPPK